MRIQKFNEASRQKEKPWVFVHDDNEYTKTIKIFPTQMAAADYYIKFINKLENQNFEPYFDENGNRFFAFVEENDDFDSCVEFAADEHINIYIDEAEIFNGPFKGKLKGLR